MKSLLKNKKIIISASIVIVVLLAFIVATVLNKSKDESNITSDEPSKPEIVEKVKRGHGYGAQGQI